MRRPAALILIAALALAAGIGAMVWHAGNVAREPGQVIEGTGSSIGGPFALIDQYGRSRTDKDFRGRYMLVYFGYTNCPDVCPTTLSVMADAMDKLEGAAKEVVPVFITVDPARDTVPVMKQYITAFGPEFVGLTGSAAAIQTAVKEYRVYEKQEKLVNGSYAVDHSNSIYLMGPDGKFIASYDETLGPDALAAAIMKHTLS